MVLVGVAIAWILTQLFTVQAARFVIQRAKDESRSQKDDVVEHFDEKLDSFEGRFSAAYKEDMETIAAEMDKIPQRIKMTAMSDKGAEVRALQSYIDRSGGEEMGQEVEMTVQEALATEDPDTVLAMGLQKLQNSKLSDRFVEDHPLQAQAWDFGKIYLANKLREALLGVPSAKVLERGKFPSVYGK